MIAWSQDKNPVNRGNDGADDTASGPIAVTLSDPAEALGAIEMRLQRREGFTLATLNLDHVVKLRRDPAFRAAYERHDLVTADGNPIVWLSRLAGRRIALVPGSELVEPTAGIAARHGVPVALCGATEDALAAAAGRLERNFPDLRVVARIAPPMGFDPAGPDADALIAQLRDTGVRLCFVALGAPKQEIFAARAAKTMPETGFLSIGAGLDFIAGTQRRAPRLVRVLAAEWLWRLMGNPRRFAKRYGACIGILPSLLVEALRSRNKGTGKNAA